MEFHAFQSELFSSVYADLLLIFALSLKSYNAVDQSEKRIVSAFAYVVTGIKFRSSLSDKNVACENFLSVCTLCAKSLGFAVTTVVGRTGTFLMSK